MNEPPGVPDVRIGDNRRIGGDGRNEISPVIVLRVGERWQHRERQHCRRSTHQTEMHDSPFSLARDEAVLSVKKSAGDTSGQPDSAGSCVRLSESERLLSAVHRLFADDPAGHRRCGRHWCAA